MLIAWILKDGKKVDVASKHDGDKENFKEVLKNQNVKFDGVDKIYNLK